LIRTPEGNGQLGRRRRKCENIELDLEEKNGKCLPELYDFGQGPVPGSCEHGNEILSDEFLDKMSN
jgi:hypothetical protein